MKTITYNPETHVLVPREPTEEMFAAANKIDDEMYCGGSQHGADIDQVYCAMLAAAPQPEPNHNWCAGCSPDNCSGCGAEPVDSEPAMWVMKHIRSGDLAQAKPNQKALHPYMWSDAFPRYTTPQPDRVAELEAALKAENATAWAQAHRLALELECLLLDTKDNAIVSKWWDSGMAALNEYQQLKPGAKEDAEAWAKMRKEMK